MRMWATRPATPADLPALRQLCIASVGPDDYVLGFLKRFLRDSVTFLALDGATRVGMMVYDDTPGGGVWLHAARTHPAYRRQGVATSLNAACEALARSRGRRALRLWASASNTASVAAAQGSGFGERARFTRMRLEVPKGTRGVRLDPIDLAKDWPAARASPLLALGRGYLFHDFYFLPMTGANARWLARHDALWRLGTSLVSLSDAYEGLRGKDLQIQLVAGDPAALLGAAARIAKGRGAERVESFLPHDAALLALARDAGFDFMDWGREAVLFEKPLRAPVGGAGRGPPQAAGHGARRSSAVREAAPVPGFRGWAETSAP